MIFEQKSVSTSTQQPFYFSDVHVSLLWDSVRHLSVGCQVRCNGFFFGAISNDLFRLFVHFVGSIHSSPVTPPCSDRKCATVHPVRVRRTLNLSWTMWYVIKIYTVHCDPTGKSAWRTATTKEPGWKMVVILRVDEVKNLSSAGFLRDHFFWLFFTRPDVIYFFAGDENHSLIIEGIKFICLLLNLFIRPFSLFDFIVNHQLNE